MTHERNGYFGRVQRAVECLASCLDETLDLAKVAGVARFLSSSEEPRNLPCIEEYLNDPRQVPVKEFRTALLMPLRGQGS